jgi:hypothetical protein
MSIKHIVPLILVCFLLTGCDWLKSDEKIRTEQGLPPDGALLCEHVFPSDDVFDSMFFDPLKNVYHFEGVEEDLFEATAHVRQAREDVEFKISDGEGFISDEEMSALKDEAARLQDEEDEITNEFTALLNPLISAHVCYGMSSFQILESCESTLMNEYEIDRVYAAEICGDCHDKARARHCTYKEDVTISTLLDYSYTGDNAPTDEDVRDIFVSDPFLWDLDEARDIIGNPCAELNSSQDTIDSLEDQIKELTNDIQVLEVLIDNQEDIMEKNPSHDAEYQMNDLYAELNKAVEEQSELSDQWRSLVEGDTYNNLKEMAEKLGYDCGPKDVVQIPPEEVDQVQNVFDVKVYNAETETICGGTVSFFGYLSGEFGQVDKVDILVAGDSNVTDNTMYDEGSGGYVADLALAPGTYSYSVVATSTSGETIAESVGAFTIDPCDQVDQTGDDTDTDQVDNDDQDQTDQIDTVVDDEEDQTETDQTGTGSCTDSCTDWTMYGFPVCDDNNWPVDCQAPAGESGWDCYSWEENGCEPELRCFCIAPPEDMVIY